jgi:hypothetical protein
MTVLEYNSEYNSHMLVFRRQLFVGFIFPFYAIILALI